MYTTEGARNKNNKFRCSLQAALQDLNCELEASLAARGTGVAVKAEVLDPPAWGNRFKLNDGTWDLIKARPRPAGPPSQGHHRQSTGSSGCADATSWICASKSEIRTHCTYVTSSIIHEFYVQFHIVFARVAAPGGAFACKHHSRSVFC